ncbi:MAG: glutamyl-tRNA reductase [Saprospiraceae bacterium]|nr:glutamyl-tRNA reductase [Saprospiraceae bacterium]
MIGNYKILTVTHKKTNLKEIGGFVLSTDKEDTETKLERLKKQFDIEELFYVSTCNRVLFFLYCEKEIDHSFAAHFFQAVNPNLPLNVLENIEDYTLALQGEDAIQHFFEVAASIDSLVIGERQILGQLREAFEQNTKWQLVGDHLRMAFQQAVIAAKGVYSKTKIGDKPVSVASLAIQKLLRANLPKDARILMIGAGQTNQLVAKFLVKHQYHNVVVSNRSPERAASLAKFLEGESFPYEELKNYNQGFDCIIVCTGAKEPIITADFYRNILGGDVTKKVIIDLAIPHNVAEEVVQDFNVHYIEIDGLRNLAKENLSYREQELHKAKVLLQEYINDFPTVLKQRQLELAMRQVPTAIKAIKQKAMDEVFRKDLEEIDEHTKALIDKMLTYMEKKCISIPMKAAREAVIG